MDRFADDSLDFVSIGNSICNNCKYKTKNKSTCKAFPNGIPAEILTGKFDHHNAYDSDGGIRFKNLRAP